MADAFETQCRSHAFDALSFEDRFSMLVDKEWDQRRNTKLAKLIRMAEFRHPNACMEAIEYHPDRKLDKSQMLELSTCGYIIDSHHIILKGASGNGKTYIACALGIAACRPENCLKSLKHEPSKVRLSSAPSLNHRAGMNGSVPNRMQQYPKPSLTVSSIMPMKS
jgi:DNA replication protein DnaC